MTTFTTNDREEAYKKINEDVVPIPFAGWVNTSPPHIVDSGASLMDKEPAIVEIKLLRQYIAELEKGLDSSINLNKAQAERQIKDLTDEEIMDLWVKHLVDDIPVFARAILRKAQEK
jgi:hypothetical protein